MFRVWLNDGSKLEIQSYAHIGTIGIGAQKKGNPGGIDQMELPLIPFSSILYVERLNDSIQ